MNSLRLVNHIVMYLRLSLLNMIIIFTFQDYISVFVEIHESHMTSMNPGLSTGRVLFTFDRRGHFWARVCVPFRDGLSLVFSSFHGLNLGTPGCYLSPNHKSKTHCAPRKRECVKALALDIEGDTGGTRKVHAKPGVPPGPRNLLLDLRTICKHPADCHVLALDAWSHEYECRV